MGINMDNIIPPISVIVPSIGRDTLERTLDSIFECRYPNIEVIVSFNNCSIERVRHIENHYPRAKIIYTEDKLFPYEAKNRGIKGATGKYLTFLDDDDSALPAKFFDLSRILEREKENFACFGMYNVRDCYTNKIKNNNCGGNKTPCFDTLIENNYIASGSIMYRNTKDIWFRETPYGWGEDYDMNLRLIAKYEFMHLATPTYIWTQNLEEGYTATFKKNQIDWKPLTQDIIDYAKQNYRDNRI